MLFIILLFVGLSFSHLLTIALLRLVRRKGCNLRHYVVIGAGTEGRFFVNTMLVIFLPIFLFIQQIIRENAFDGL